MGSYTQMLTYASTPRALWKECQLGICKTSRDFRRSSDNKQPTRHGFSLVQMIPFNFTLYLHKHITDLITHMAPSSAYMDFILGREGDQAPPVGGSRDLHFGEQNAGTETPNSQYCHSHEASECLCCLLDMDTNPPPRPPRTHTHKPVYADNRWPPGSHVPNCCLPSLRSAPLYRNTAPNLIKVGLFSFEGYHTHELLWKHTKAPIHG